LRRGFFQSPKIVFGENALSYLEQVQEKRPFVVTDAMMKSLGFVKRVEDHLTLSEIQSAEFVQVEAGPPLETEQACVRLKGFVKRLETCAGGVWLD
jgi:alcohol dehydrogenase class IV